MKPYLTTLKKYKIVFTTLDGEEHEYRRINYVDDKTLRCAVGDYYLIEKRFLKDDECNIYPIENIQKIRFDLIDIIENVIEKRICGHMRYIWYPEDEIEIYSEKS